MYEIVFKGGNKYTGEYGPVTFIEGIAKTDDEWIAAWFKGRGFEVNSDEDITQDITNLTVDQLKELAKEKGIEGFSKMKKEELIEVLQDGE